MSDQHSSGQSSSDKHSHDHAKHIRIYILVFVALLVGTVITVALNSIHFSSMALTIFVALFVAVVKAFLVAGYFMHLISEKKAIYSVLAATAFFFAGMLYLILWSREGTPTGTIHYGDGTGRPVSATATAPAAPAH